MKFNNKEGLRVLGILAIICCLMFALGITAFATEAETTNVAKIGNTEYATLADAFANVKNGDTVVLLADISVDTETYTIADGVSVTLDMNGKTITVTDNATGNCELFYILGEMTVEGNGTIELTSTNDRDWNAMSAIFHNRGGVLTIENGTFKNCGGTDMAWVADNSGNHYGDATTNINGGTLESTYTAIRNRMEQNSHGASGKAILNINGGKISGTTSAVWAQAASTSTTSPATGEINVAGGEVGLINTARSDGAECMTTISGGTVAGFKGEVGELVVKESGTITGDVTILTATGEEAKFDVNSNGEYVDVSNYAAKIGDTYYATLADAIKSIEKGAGETTVTLLQNITIGNQFVGHTYPQKVILDMNGHTVSSSGKAFTVYRSGTTLTLKNGTVSGNTTGGTIQVTYGGKLIFGENVTIKGAGGSATLLKVDNGAVKIADKNVVTFVGGKIDLSIADACKDNVEIEAYIKADKTRTYFSKLTDAVAAAKDGETVTLVNNVTVDKEDAVTMDNGTYYTFFLVEGKTITIDLKGKNITANGTGLTDKMIVGLFATDNKGHLILNDSAEGAKVSMTEGEEVKLYALIANYEEDCSIIINGGNYYADSVYDCLMYTGCNEGITVNGGTFELGNIGGGHWSNNRGNGSPWMFNAKGQNTAHVLVNGGAFNADVQHQYYVFEVLMPKEKALKNVGVTYTVVPAVAYVTEREWSSKWYTNEVGYATLEEAIKACEGPQTKVYYKNNYTSEQEVVVLLKDVALENTLTIPAGKTVVLDLNGKTISGTFSGTGNQEMFLVKGNLTVTNGTINMKATVDQDWNAMATIFDVTAGGILNINNATIDNKGGTDMAFCVHMNNWGEVTLNADEVTFKSTYIAIRVFNSGYDMNNVTINNSTLEGKYCFWVHNYIGDLDSNKHSNEAIDARLNFDIYDNGNTFIAENAYPVLYGFNVCVYFDENGNKIAI